MRPGGGRVLFLAFLVSAAVGFAALGVWQLERLLFKNALIARVDARVAAPPVPAPPAAAWPTLNPQAEEYRRVRVTGRYLPGRDTMVDALTELGAGYWVLSPLATADGAVLVNRGFVPKESTARLATPRGPVTVIGLLRPSEPGGRFLRSNRPGEGRWYSRDVAAIARDRGIGPVAPFFIDAERGPEPQRPPIGGLTVVRFRNAHLAYALTWFALAAMAGVGASIVGRSRARG